MDLLKHFGLLCAFNRIKKGGENDDQRPKRFSSSEGRRLCQDRLGVYSQLQMGNVSLNDFITAYDATDAAEKEYAKKDVELTGVKDSRDDNARHLNDLVTRFRSGMRSVYGPDSAQYGQAGGTRARDRKPPRPRAKAATG